MNRSRSPLRSRFFSSERIVNSLLSGMLLYLACIFGATAVAETTQEETRKTRSIDKVIHVDIETRTLNKQSIRKIDEKASLIDLTQKSWRKGEIYTLDGQWDMFWNLLAVPDVLYNIGTGSEPFIVPGLWNDPKGDNVVRDRFGFATFRVNVKIPPALEPIYLRLPDMPSAYSLWVNGEPLAFNGVVGFGQQSEQPNFGPKVVQVRNHGGFLELVLQVSNFHYKEGGIWHSIKITGQSGEPYLKTWPMLFDAFIFTLLVAIGLYHISVFVMRRQERAALYFGLLCLAVGLRSIMVGQRVIYMADWFSWEFLQAAEHILFYAGMPFFVNFYRALFPKEVSPHISFGAWFTFAVFSVLTLITPVNFFAMLAFPFQIIVVLMLVYIIFTWFKAFKAKRPGARLFGTSWIIMFVAVINDFLNANFVIQTVNVFEYGLLAFVISQVVLLNRRYVHSLSVTENLSETLKEHNEQLIKLDEFKDEFLATTSHELRMPLHSIYGLAHVVMDDPGIKSSQSQKHNLELIAATAKRLSTLVNDILDFSSIKHGRLELHQEPVDVRVMIGTLLDTMSPLIGGKDVVMSADFDSTIRYVDADPNRLQQILFNLVGNAIKFTDDGFVLIKARSLDNQVEIEVVDTGIGIPQDKQGLVLNPFEKLEQREKHQYTGTGLGLSISKQLVEMQGGKLSLESRVGFGTTVKFTLPAASEKAFSDPSILRDEKESIQVNRPEIPDAVLNDPQTVTHTAKSAAKEPVDEEYALLYVVDDEEVNRQLLSRQLQNVGFVVEAFAGGNSMLTKLQTTVPDLIVLDLMMPNMNGFEVLSYIREKFNSYELPVVMLTARHQTSDIIRALNLGANDYLCKPYHDKELIARVSSLLSVRKFWRVREENERLAQEIQRRIKAEENLTFANQRLLTVLNHTEEPIALLDNKLCLLYANQALMNLLDEKSISDLLELEDYLSEDVCNKLRACAEGDGAGKSSTVQQPAIDVVVHDRSIAASLTARRFTQADQSFLALAIVPGVASENSAIEIISDISAELSANRSRIDALENALQSVSQLLNAEQKAPSADEPVSVQEKIASENEEVAEGDATNGMNESAQQDHFRREKLVDLLRHSMNFWERYSGKGKTELAEESKCWRVYLDGGTVKTRTLDKYLSLKTLPENPRWRSVIRTANFVMAKCEMNPEDQKRLSTLIREIEESFS